MESVNIQICGYSVMHAYKWTLMHLFQKGLSMYNPLFTLCFAFLGHVSDPVTSYSLHLEKQHDAILEALFEAGTYKKLYSYSHLINGFAVHTSHEQVNYIYIYICFFSLLIILHHMCFFFFFSSLPFQFVW